MDIKLTKNDNGGYDAEVIVSFELGDIDIKEVEERDGNKISVYPSVMVESMVNMYKDRLTGFIEKQSREEFKEFLGEYVRYHILNSIGIQSVPVRGIEGRDGEITKIEGIRDEVDYNLTIEGDGK